MEEKKKVGNACRTLNQIRHSKASGSAFEYDIQYSLTKMYPDIYLTKQRGFQLMYDVQTDEGKMVIECKRLKGISWNTLVKLYDKLQQVKPVGYWGIIAFKSNQQPCLIYNGHTIKTFEDYFELPFLKHEPVKRCTLQ